MPIIREKTYKERGTTYRLRVEAGMHYIRGNSAPYFSLTASVDERRPSGGWREYMGGCCHDLIVKHYPELSRLANLHLSDIDGAPSYAVENGFYWYKGGCQLGTRWLAADMPHDATSYTQVLARHLRISKTEAANLQARGLDKAEFSAYVDTQRPRWKREAVEVISEHGLVVYGDTWAPKGAAA